CQSLQCIAMHVGWSDRPVQPIYEKLKSQGILVRYMDYTQGSAGAWGDGLRMSVGTDSEIDALLMVLKSILGSSGITVGET
ncbi:MAG: hypothetical protein ACKOAH_20780, partial [Pirellula sp.]